MWQTIKDRHRGESIALLGSGPSLVEYRGDAQTAIAVNGAALCPYPYAYFVCGDLLSPQAPWFAASETHSARRIVASFVAPFDSILYPESSVRARLQAELAPWTNKAIVSDQVAALYPFTPSESPAQGHLWFHYDSVHCLGAPLRLSAHRRALEERGGAALLKKSFLEEPTDGNAALPLIERTEFPRLTPQRDSVYTGGTVVGVALQIAYLMGAKRIELFGCSFDNEQGQNYFVQREGMVGYTTQTQIDSLLRLMQAVEAQGVEVVVHGPSRLTAGSVGAMERNEFRFSFL